MSLDCEIVFRVLFLQSGCNALQQIHTMLQ